MPPPPGSAPPRAVRAFDRPVRFEEVDAAGIVFFARYVTYAHEAMEHFFADLEPSGYAGLILERRVGLPAVHVEISFAAPARYGDTLRVETTVARLGNRSATFRYRMLRAPGLDLVAEVLHTVVTTNLDAMRSCEMPEDVRAAFGQYLEPGAP